MISDTIHLTIRTVDLFRKLEMGKTFKMESDSYESPHSFAKQAGIRVSVQKLGKGEHRKYVLEVTRIPNTKKAQTPGRKPGSKKVE